MGFDTGYGGDQQSGGGSFFDDPQFLAQLQGAFGGGGPTNLGAGGNAVYSPAQKPMGPVSLPDGSQATSPFEVGGNSGGPATPWDQNTGQRIPGGGGGMERPPWMTGGGYGGRMPTDAESGGAPGRGIPGGGGGDGGGVESTPGGMDLRDLARRFQHPQQQPYGMGPGGPLGGGRDGSGGGGGRYGGGGAGGGWYGGYGNQGGGGQQQWYRPQPQGTNRPPAENPGAAYDAGPGKWEAQQAAQGGEARDPKAPPASAPPRWQMPQGGAYGRPMPMQRRRRYYGNSGAPMPAGQGAPVPAPPTAYAGPGGSPLGGTYI